MTTHNRNLIAALNKAFDADDIIKDNAQDWTLESLIWTICEADDEQDDEDDDKAEFYAVPGAVYPVDASGHIGSIALYTKGGTWS